MALGESATEQVVLRLKPAWRSFVVFYAVVGFLVVVALKDTFHPLVGRPFPVTPPVAFTLAALLLGLILAKRRATEYSVSTRRVRRRSLLGSRELELARIDELKVYRPMVQRLMGTGKLVMADSHDLTSRIQFYGVEQPIEVQQTIARLISEAKP